VAHVVVSLALQPTAQRAGGAGKAKLSMVACMLFLKQNKNETNSSMITLMLSNSFLMLQIGHLSI